MNSLKKHIKTIVIIMGICALLYLSYLGNKISQKDNTFSHYTDESLTSSPGQKDLGIISMKKGVVSTTFTIKNTFSKPIVLGKSNTSCMCTTAYLISPEGKKSPTINMHTPVNLDTTIQPGEVYKLVADFDPNAHGPDATGPISRDIYIETNSTTTPKLRFNIYGEVVK